MRHSKTIYLTIAEVTKLKSLNCIAKVVLEDGRWTINLRIDGNIFFIKGTREDKERVYTTINAATNALFRCGINRFEVINNDS